MQITILAVGKLKERYLVSGCEEYLKRLARYAQVKVIEVADEPAPANASPAEEEQVKEKEGQKILASIPANSYVIALAIAGETVSSPQLAKKLEKLALQGKSKLAFIIGGSLGLHETVLERADWRLSFSALTFPHQLMRLILLEQLYRCFKINRGETYHK
ncbi:MAG: 23S rRNA (pseudouridine(1915)-N(3))-methyltransferase RlmH [Thermoanaerobacteraceae bacterium]|nr:23S rRNA (pseudouridine(1915)-N(3))-methyltransferase RlmH [Thermoanaerobacteraceae bacterium]